MEKLQRQRALVQEHLRWLDSEIATEASKPGVADSPPPSPHAPQVTAAAIAPPAPSSALSDGALSEIPEPNIQGLHNEVRSGCFLYFGIAALAFGLVVAFIYWRY